MAVATDWKPLASQAVLVLRATLLGRIRAFFAALDVLEVDTPVLSLAASTDPVLHSFYTCSPADRLAGTAPRYLHTSPEFPMKRLLAAGSGSIYQVCKVFRNGEQGARHNPEFTLLEWYRTGFDHLDLMDEVERLLVTVLEGILPVTSVHHWCYRDLFIDITGVDPFATSVQSLRDMLATGFGVATAGQLADDLDTWLDLVMSHVIEPRLGEGLVFIRDYPASQASLARLRSANPAVASRFEVYLNGMELANGFHELADADEQARRFSRELQQRQASDEAVVPVDERLLGALRAGLPDCAGVALGVDRLLMLACGATDIRDVLAFPYDVA